MDTKDNSNTDDKSDTTNSTLNETTNSTLNETTKSPLHTTNNTTIKTFNITIPYVHQPFIIGTVCWLLGLCGGWIWSGIYYVGSWIWPLICYLGMILGVGLAIVIVSLMILGPLSAMTKPDDASINRFVFKVKQLHKQNEELGRSNDLINSTWCSQVANSDVDPIPIDWGFFKIARIMNQNQFNRSRVYIVGAFRGWYLFGL